MRATLSPLSWLAAMLVAVALIGCGPKSDSKPEDDHPDHPTEGPHHGSLIELGKEEYHGELVHDEKAGTVTIYILDSTAKKSFAIDAKEVIINLKHEGEAEQFKLAASPDKDDPAGKSSRFVSKDKHLSEDLDEKGVDARLVVKIGEKSYSGKMKHDHKGHKHPHKHGTPKD